MTNPKVNNEKLTLKWIYIIVVGMKIWQNKILPCCNRKQWKKSRGTKIYWDIKKTKIYMTDINPAMSWIKLNEIGLNSWI